MAARREVPSAESAGASEKGVWEAFSKALEVKLDLEMGEDFYKELGGAKSGVE